ncbi:hypothetical protein RRG08_027703 [Elysia crispata]|uniref:Uncharacterized protein n=1 Tax=Elysia crispata TaxID=231223 RepID=A0AAE0XM87_9GAST|nr:hypothetical protein RRG08_027703 [Elysia crispata]
MHFCFPSHPHPLHDYGRRKKKCIRYKQNSDGGEGTSGRSANGGADNSISRAHLNSNAEMDNDDEDDSDIHNSSMASGHRRLQHHHFNQNSTLDSSILSGCESDSTSIPQSMNSPGHPGAKIARYHEATLTLNGPHLHNGDSVRTSLNGHHKSILDRNGRESTLAINGEGDDLDSDRFSDNGSPLSPIVDENDDIDEFSGMKPSRRQSQSETDSKEGEENHKSLGSKGDGRLSASASASLSALSLTSPSLAHPSSLLTSGASGLSLPPSPFIHSHHHLVLPPSPSSSALTSSPLPPPRRLTPHTVDSFLFSPPPLRLPGYPLPPSPLAAMPMPYYGLASFHHPHFPLPPHSPHNPRSPPLPSPKGSSYSLDIKPSL